MNEDTMRKFALPEEEITSAKLSELVDEYLAEGGVITQCDPGAALNLRSVMSDPNNSLKLKRPAPIRRKPPRRVSK